MRECLKALSNKFLQSYEELLVRYGNVLDQLVPANGEEPWEKR